MDLATFQTQYKLLTSVRDQAALLMPFAEEYMQSCPEDLRPLLVDLGSAARGEGLAVEAGLCERLLGWLAFDRSDYAVAQGHFDEALRLFESTGNLPGRLRALNGMASTYSEQGQLESALVVYREALQLAESLGDEGQMMVLRPNIGETLAQLQQYQEAEPHFRAALVSGLLSPLNESLVLNQLARTLMAQKRVDEAQEALVRSIQLARHGSYLSSLATALNSLGELDLIRGTTENTRLLLAEAQAVARQAGDRSTEARATLDLGRLELARNNPAEALILLRDALDLCQTIGNGLLEAEVWRWSGEARKELGHWKEALEAQEKYHRSVARIHDERVGRQLAQMRADQAKRETDLLREQTRVLTLLGDLGQRITASLDLETIVLTVYEAIGGLMRAETFGLGLYHPEKSLIEYRLFIENGVRIPPFEASSEAETFSAWSIRHRQDLLLGDVEQEFRQYIPALPLHFGDKTRHSQSCLYTPLMAEGKVLGVLSAQSYERNAYSPRDLATFKTLAASISIAVQNARLFERVNLLATVDSLTGASTRRHLFERTEEEFQRFLRDRVPLALVMIDLDHFKALNDSWGHAVGDRVLAEFGALCLTHKRPHDLFGRYGGEEFALVLASTTLEGAGRSAERLCREVAALPLVLENGSPLTLTASFGVTAFRSRDIDITRVFNRADEALYEAKLAGRNRVVVKP